MNIPALLAGLFSGIVGSMGLGGGAVLVIYLVFLADEPQIKAGALNLLFFIPIALLSVIIYAFKKQIRFKEIRFIIPGGIIGCVAGIFFGLFFGNTMLSKVFGGFLCFLGMREIVNTVKLYLKKDKNSSIISKE